jgi:hypothetical protein
MEKHTSRRRWSAHAPGTLAAVVVVTVVTSFAAVGATTVANGTARSSATSSSKPAAAHRAVAHRCFGLFPGRGAGDHYIEYPAGCSGHDEPDLAAISSGANTASNITWTVILSTDGTGTLGRKVVDLGPTFWFGAAVKDSKSLYGQAFQELQFYPDSTLTSPACGSDGSFTTISTPNKYTVCSPVWAVKPSTFEEYAAFNGMLKRSGTTQPLVMNAGDTVTVHYFKGTQAGTPFNIVVTDVTSGQHSATLVLSGGVDGPLAPLTGANTTSNFMRWGAVQQAPLSLAWEIGHPNQYTYPLAPACFHGMFTRHVQLLFVQRDGRVAAHDAIEGAEREVQRQHSASIVVDGRRRSGRQSRGHRLLRYLRRGRFQRFLHIPLVLLPGDGGGAGVRWRVSQRHELLQHL